jgi:PTH2 family peptidyl-tRNA hydrolase
MIPSTKISRERQAPAVRQTKAGLYVAEDAYEGEYDFFTASGGARKPTSSEPSPASNDFVMPGEGSGQPSEPTPEETAAELRMWLVVRTDIDMPRPKFGAQSGHGFGACLWLAAKERPEIANEYMSSPAQAKICLAAKNLNALERVFREARDAGLPAVIVRDHARTHFAEPTYTVSCVGPCRRYELPKFIQKLQLLKA